MADSPETTVAEIAPKADAQPETQTDSASIWDLSTLKDYGQAVAAATAGPIIQFGYEIYNSVYQNNSSFPKIDGDLIRSFLTPRNILPIAELTPQKAEPFTGTAGQSLEQLASSIPTKIAPSIAGIYAAAKIAKHVGGAVAGSATTGAAVEAAKWWYQPAQGK